MGDWRINAIRIVDFDTETGEAIPPKVVFSASKQFGERLAEFWKDYIPENDGHIEEGMMIACPAYDQWAMQN